MSPFNSCIGNISDSDTIGDNNDEEFDSDSDLNWNRHDVRLMILCMKT